MLIPAGSSVLAEAKAYEEQAGILPKQGHIASYLRRTHTKCVSQKMGQHKACQPTGIQRRDTWGKLTLPEGGGFAESAGTIVVAN